MRVINGRPIFDGDDFSSYGESFKSMMNKNADILEEAANLFSSTVDGDDLEADAGVFAGALAVTGAVTGASFVASGVSAYSRLGTFASALKGSGVVLDRSTNTAALRVYSDDNGAVLTGAGSVPDIRGALSRVLLTKDNSGGNIRVFGLMGHIKGYDAEWAGEQVGAVHGYLELVRNAGTINLQGYGVSAGVQATVETSGAITLDANHVIAGVASISKMISTLTQTGKTAAFYAGIYDVTNWSDSTARSKWKYGLYIQAAGCTEGIRVGELSSSVDTSGIALSATQTAAVRVHADTGGAALAASNCRATLSRFLIGTAISSAADISAYGLEGLLKSIVSVSVTGNHAGILGHFESAGTLTLTGTINVVKAGVASFLDLAANATVAANTVVSAFGVNPANFGTTMTGRSAIIHVTNPMAGTWGSFLDMSTATGLTQDSAAGATGDKFLKVYLNGVLYTIAMARA